MYILGAFGDTFLRVGYWMNGIGVAGIWIKILVSFTEQAQGYRVEGRIQMFFLLHCTVLFTLCN